MSRSQFTEFIDAPFDDDEDLGRRSISSFLTEQNQSHTYDSTPSSSAPSRSCSSWRRDEAQARALLLHTFTMSSGSSGADTYSSMSSSDNQSSSELESDTPPETPGLELGGFNGDEGDIENTPVLGQLWSSRIQPTSLRVLSTVQKESADHVLGAEDVLVKGLGIVQLASNGTFVDDDAREFGWKRSRPPRRTVGELHQVSPGPWFSAPSTRDAASFEELEARVCEEAETHTGVSSIRRARRPPPLNLSASKSRKDSTVDIIANGFPGGGHGTARTVEHPRSAPIENTWKPGLSEADLLPPLPATAPLTFIPKAPRVRPLVDFGRSPSPLMLPSPEFRGTSTSTPLSAISVPTPPLGHTPSPTQSFNSRPRLTTSPSLPSTRVSLTQKIANLRRTSLNAPIPPSLLSSPRLAHVKTPTEPQSPVLSSLHSSPTFRASAHSPNPKSGLATPLKRYMNPYFDNALILHAYDGMNRSEPSLPPAAAGQNLVDHKNIGSPPLDGPFFMSHLNQT
ncbi:hypothetical protein PIIN_09715 [Serendipita indica DSM 11827]|uniref:Uncharacterized protein n=1 Tax=Serendipita indica (strain DSM 11827) TaxID=1109443 RepID=G4TWN2_SERID|nr:hypothetical protein PIIN_09715 [Serendipita indica DSM 11827]